jgi:hypothetical protein
MASIDLYRRLRFAAAIVTATTHVRMLCPH